MPLVYNCLAILVGLLTYISYEFYFKIEYSPVIELTTGSVRGYTSKSRLGREFYSWLGIKYAKHLRFENPQPPEAWPGVLDAVSFGAKCIQVDGLTRTITGDEDCLFLNVFVPKEAFLMKKNLPVIFYIHGGFFMTGSSSYMGPDYLMDEDIILITANYRLNVFGFLSTGDSSASGNFGLKDQHLALKWTQQNIKYFSGDPQKVTLAGQSAGAAAVHFHLLSPSNSQELFSGAIMSSGSAIKPWSLSVNPKEQAENLAKKLNCPIVSSSKLISCLKKVDAADIIRAQIHALDTPIMKKLEIFAPTVENGSPEDPNVFLPSHPYDILTSGKGSNVPILTSINSEEGLLYTGRILNNASLQTQVENHWNELSPNFLVYNSSETELTTKIRQFYFKNNPSDKLFKENFQNLTNVFSDRLYIHAQRETVQIQSQFSPVYLYYFSYPLKKGLMYFSDINPNWPIVPQFAFKEVKWFLDEYIFHREHLSLGVMHGDDVALIFKFPLIDVSQGSKDYPMSRLMVKMWAQFAKNPTQMNFNGSYWPPRTPSDSQNLKYMLISNSSASGSLIDEPFANRMTFWDELNIPWRS